MREGETERQREGEKERRSDGEKERLSSLLLSVSPSLPLSVPPFLWLHFDRSPHREISSWASLCAAMMGSVIDSRISGAENLRCCSGLFGRSRAGIGQSRGGCSRRARSGAGGWP